MLITLDLIGGQLMMEKHGKLVLSTIAVALMLFAGMLPFFSGSAQGAVPEWQEGQEWALAGG